MSSNTLEFILSKFHTGDKPTEIPNTGRDTMATWFKELDFKAGAEIGVLAGEYSEVLCKSNPECLLYGVDPLIPYAEYKDYQKPSTFNKAYEDLLIRTKGQNFKLIRKFSADALDDFMDESLDFVYIDANHDFVNTTFDIYNWSKKVRKGGIISGHDYFPAQSKTNHVFHVINAYTKSYRINPWFVLGSNAEIEGQIRDRVRSWFWVK